MNSKILILNLFILIIFLHKINSDEIPEDLTKKIIDSLFDDQKEKKEEPKLNLKKIVESKEKKEKINCNERLIDNENILNNKDYEKLCEIISKYPLFLVRFSNKIIYKKSLSSLFEVSSYKYFDKKCLEFKFMCEFGFLIDIFTSDKILLIQPGSKSKDLVNDLNRERIIFSLNSELKQNKWIKALKKIIFFIIYIEEGKELKYFDEINEQSYNYFIKILLPLLLLGFISLTSFLYFASKGFINNDVYEFFDNVIEKWTLISNETEGNNEKFIILEPLICIFCWQKTSNKREVFMYCGHSYHEKCLRKWRLYQYRCCPCTYLAIKENEEKNQGNFKPIKLYLEDLKILLGLCLDAFRKQSIYDYFIENEKKISDFNEKYEISIEELCWLSQSTKNEYKKFRIIYKMYKVVKMSIFFLAFYPQFLKIKKVKLISKLLKVKNEGGATYERIN